MNIRTSPEITFGRGDFLRTDRGITWGIKVTQIPEAVFAAVFVHDGTRWTIGAMLDDALDLNAAEYPDMQDWLKRKCVPALNSWLASKFPALDHVPPPVAGTRAEQADAAIQGLRIAVSPVDGTLLASVP